METIYVIIRETENTDFGCPGGYSEPYRDFVGYVTSAELAEQKVKELREAEKERHAKVKKTRRGFLGHIFYDFEQIDPIS